jgi:hypothetical protein
VLPFGDLEGLVHWLKSFGMRRISTSEAALALGAEAEPEEVSEVSPPEPQAGGRR